MGGVKDKSAHILKILTAQSFFCFTTLIGPFGFPGQFHMVLKAFKIIKTSAKISNYLKTINLKIKEIILGLENKILFWVLEMR